MMAAKREEEAINLFRLCFPSHPGGFFIGAAGQSTTFVTAATKNTDTHPQPPKIPQKSQDKFIMETLTQP